MAKVKIPDAGGAALTMVDVGDFITPIFFKSAQEIKDIFDNVPNFKFRNDDLMLCTFSKTGTNWVYEILMMILNRSAERIQTYKVFTMLEGVTAEEADQQPSPRVMNCHYRPKYLPLEDMRAKQIKTVLCLRNPKDTAVSYYNHMKGLNIYDYDGKWEDWLPVYGLFVIITCMFHYIYVLLDYGKYSDYLLHWQKRIQEGPGFPLHIMYYEDLKMGQQSIQFCCNIISFQQMATDLYLGDPTIALLVEAMFYSA
ncbi:sulfotransferase 1B1-like [Ruditapes philippinarum]|uniref:sulfotransferase 1B1-like n=1 Tax=Ruditapes philippinarum TaxID=129788 RepID=UPI00295BC843|nr:sulfotransferase 1B1-like [Ruditapes philippinarum]